MEKTWADLHQTRLAQTAPADGATLGRHMGNKDIGLGHLAQGAALATLVLPLVPTDRHAARLCAMTGVWACGADRWGAVCRGGFGCSEEAALATHGFERGAAAPSPIAEASELESFSPLTVGKWHEAGLGKV